LNRFTRI